MRHQSYALEIRNLRGKNGLQGERLEARRWFERLPFNPWQTMLTWPGAVAAGREQGTKVMDTGGRINICFMWRVKTKTGSEVIPWFLAGVTQEMVHWDRPLKIPSITNQVECPQFHVYNLCTLKLFVPLSQTERSVWVSTDYLRKDTQETPRRQTQQLRIGCECTDYSKYKYSLKF